MIQLRKVCAWLAAFTAAAFAQPRSPADTGAPQVTVTHSGSQWTLAGKKQTVTLDASNLAIAVHAGPTVWAMMPSSAGDLLVGL